MKSAFTNYHAWVVGFFGGLAYGWTMVVLPELVQFAAQSAWGEVGIRLLPTALLLVLMCVLLWRFDSYRKQFAAQPEAIELTGLAWSVTFLPDALYIFGPFYRKVVRYEQILRIDAGRNSRRDVSVRLICHTSKWHRPELEDGINIGTFATRSALEVVRLLRDRTPHAQHSAAFLEMVETGKWL